MEPDKKTALLRSKILNASTFDPKNYEYDSSFKPWDGGDPLGVHTTAEMLEALEIEPNIELDAKVICLREKDNRIIAKSARIEKELFLESFRKDVGQSLRIREDYFGGGFGGFSSNGDLGSTLVGQDFTPLLGGPFYKNLYFYQDYIRMHAEAFYAYHNDPFAKAIVQITRDFVLGTGYEVQCDTATDQGKVAMAAWKAFEEANDLQVQIDQICEEMSIYGEVMVWELPGSQSKITYRLGPTDTRPIGIIPRVRLIDPSNLVEIVTYPEDITRPLFYVWLQPTQYQIYTTARPNELSGSMGAIQPTLKFIYRQIPAEQMMHFKINCVSNEKRGRSDFFPIFNYLRRLRDAVNYEMISLQKVAAWSIDTTIEGDQTDIDAYIQDQVAMGTIPPPGSEFIHSAAIKRNYQGNQHASSHSSDIFQWCLSCISAGVGIPVSYFGTHLSGGGTRASALVATEPVAKKMEKRREVMKRILRKLFNLCMERAGLPNIDCNIVFPEMISQDSSKKIQNLLMMEKARWIKPERAATLAAKEMAIDNYNYQEEMKDVSDQIPDIPMPLLDPSPEGLIPGPTAPSGGGQSSEEEDPGVTALTSQDKGEIKKNDRTL